MSLGTVHAGEHYHVWTKSIDGAEFGNAIYENNIDASLSFNTIMRQITKYQPKAPIIPIETIVNSLVEGRGMYAGGPGLVVVLSRCDGGCFSPVWN